MKKFLNYFCALLIGAMCLGFASCGDDDDEPSGGSAGTPSGTVTGSNLVEKLQGTWTFQKMKIQVMGQTVEMTRDELVGSTGYENFYDDVLTFSGSKVNGYDYQVDGNKILLPWYESQGWWQSVSFSGNTMILLLDVVYEGVPMKMWLTYVKTGSRAADSYMPEASISIFDAYLKK